MNDIATLTKPRVETVLKDWETDQEVRWCPGCGDYAILKAVQRTMPEIGARPENTVFVSGIGCSARLPRARRVDHHRRRRCAVDRRQSHHAPAQAQPELPGSALQQRDLRPDQG